LCEIRAGAASSASVELDAKFAVIAFMIYETSIYVIPIIVIETFHSIEHVFNIDGIVMIQKLS